MIREIDKRGNTKEWANQLAIYAQQSVLYEAILYPKPGLVDSIDNGSHTDMNVFTFMDSSCSLYEGFYNYSKAGLMWDGSPRQLFEHIRPIGIELENRMLKETNGINTHKGIIFSMGIFLAATGFLLRDYLIQSKDLPNLKEGWDKVFQIIKEMTKNLITNDYMDLNKKKDLTNGERLFLDYGFTGIRGEAEAGYPNIHMQALPLMRKQNKEDSLNIRLLEVLFTLMATIEDSNVVHRGGIESLQFVKRQAKEFLNNGGLHQINAISKIKEMNKLFVSKNISPGGSADLLIIAIFLGKLEKLI